MQKRISLFLLGLSMLLVGCQTDDCKVKNSSDSSKETLGTAEEFKKNVKDRVFFYFDKSDVTPEAAKVLESQAAWLKTYSGNTATIEGHCDSRGTREYNLALGERRACSTRDVLAQDGVDCGRLSVKSFGKDNPPYPDAKTEEQLAQNRCAITSIN